MEPCMCCASVTMVPILARTHQSGRAESGVQPQQWMECRRHRTGPDSDQIPRRRRTGLVRDNQTDLDCGTGRPGELSRATSAALFAAWSRSGAERIDLYRNATRRPASDRALTTASLAPSDIRKVLTRRAAQLRDELSRLGHQIGPKGKGRGSSLKGRTVPVKFT